MYSAVAIANWFISKAFLEQGSLTPMKVQKLIYIAHGWFMALNKGIPLIVEEVEAWKYGPVIPDLYHDLKHYGKGEIADFIVKSTAKGLQIPDVPEGDITTNMVLDRIWDVYGKYDGVTLSRLTHAEGTPWDTKWKEMQENGSISPIIPPQYISEYYIQKSNS